VDSVVKSKTSYPYPIIPPIKKAKNLPNINFS